MKYCKHMEIDNTNQQPLTPPPQDQKEIPTSKGLNRSGIVMIAVAVIVILGILGVVAYYLFVGENNSRTDNSTSQPPSQISQSPQVTSNDFFYFSIPKPIANISIKDLPNNGNPMNVVKFNDSLWFAGDGSVIEYDVKEGKLASYSKPTKANCVSNVILVANYLFTSCMMKDIQEYSSIYSGKPDWDARYAIFKINPSTHEVEHMFTPKDGLLNTSNYYLYPDGDIVWVVTEGGVGKIDAKTNAVKFYTNELGIPGSTLSVRTMLVDKDYVWVAINANVGSQGGLSMYDKKTQTWKSSHVNDLKDKSLDRFDLEAGFKPIPGGIQIAFRDGDMQTADYPVDRLVEKQYNYQTGKWTKVGTDRPASGAQSEVTRQYVLSTYPSTPKYTTTDQSGLTQLRLPESNQIYQLDGRNNYILSPLVGDKRYILTSATIDVIDDSSPFRKILLKLGALPSSSVSYGDPSAYEGLVSFLIDSNSSLAVVTDSSCGGWGCSGDEKVWLIDLKAGKINRTYTKADGINGESLYKLSMVKEGDLLVVKDKDGISLFNINATNSNLTILKK